ncbi:hypothetical protein [Tsukamurella sp. 1534]|uniref:hypothetical protein n=1 Tax=Tsukamurella sp. 1534 TaxID=1151061 RepID=UPI0002F5CCB4|nr:hypothetical protein [Tsukamurella sp. 1534]
MNLPAKPNGEPRLWTPEEAAALGRCVICEHHPPTQGHDYRCPAYPVWHLASGKPNRPYISDEIRALAAQPDPEAEQPAPPEALDLDVQIQGDTQP